MNRLELVAQQPPSLGILSCWRLGTHVPNIIRVQHQFLLLIFLMPTKEHLSLAECVSFTPSSGRLVYVLGLAPCLAVASDPYCYYIFLSVLGIKPRVLKTSKCCATEIYLGLCLVFVLFFVFVFVF